ncbi:MAG: chemotaxis protein CheA [Deltaproteobacteria bacterium]|nr:chemotaxis protein CheA [Deltaproteobacteria bacterium]MBI4796909.1 chemotaxis protein CheA [Deltaproteobacteria bacterium]
MTDQAPDSQKLIEGLEGLALKVVMLEEGDLPGLGSFLNHLETLKELLAPECAPEVTLLFQQLEEVGNKLILQEITAAAQGQELLGQGVSLLLIWAREHKFPKDGEAWKTYCRLSQELGLGGTGERPPQSEAEPAPAPAADLEGFIWEDQELTASFITEAREHLEGIESGLVHLEQAPTDLAAINAVFRPFHTIKGVAGFLNLPQIQELSHEVESLLDEARAGRIEINAAIIDLTLTGVDRLKEMLEDLQEALSEKRPLRTFDLEDIKSQVKELQEQGPSGEVPKRQLGEILVSQGEISSSDLNQALEKQKTEAGAPPLGEILVKEGKITPKKVARALVDQLTEEKAIGEAAVSPAGTEGKAPADAQMAPTIKIDLAKVDNLVNLMGELVIAQSQVRQNPNLLGVSDQKLERDLAQMSRITTELQMISMSMRMIPIGQTLRKMVRLVRDLARKSKKQVELHIEGEETEIDRNMVEAIYDPLVHMVRNAVDHGLETPKEREVQGKPPEGHLWLRAYHKGGNVVIDIEEDGRGLDRDRILAKAQERGLLQPGDQLTPAQIDNLIFEPGFSTAEKITDISGRGVGMDVVRQTIERLQGKVEIHSRPKEGSRFSIRMPLTLAIIDGLVVKVGKERYILPAVAVRETLRPAAEDYFTVQGQGEIIKVRSQLIPLLRLHRLFRTENGETHPTKGLVMVVEYDGKAQGLLVDDILGKQEVVIKSLGETLQNIKGLAGGTILGDGRVGLILDLAGLFALGQT